MEEYYLYCRKSTEDKKKQQLSIPAQLHEMKEFADRNNIKILEIFKEEKSAKTPHRRAEFDRMISQIKQGKCKRILLWHLNRLSRNPLEGGIIQQMLTDKLILEIRTPYESLNANTNDIMLGVLFGSNSQYSKQLGVDTRRGLKAKVLRGEWPTLAPAFYINIGEEKGTKNISPDPIWGSYYERWVNQIIDKRLNLTQSTRLLKEMGVKTRKGKHYTQSMVHRIMRMPVYYGLLKYADYEPVKGKWEPLISKSKWDELQDVLDDRSKPKLTKHNHAYRKLLTCPRCGLHIVPYTKFKKNHKYTYYCCSKRNGNCGNPPITLEQLENQLLEVISQVSINHSILNQLKDLTRNKLEADYSFEISKVKESESKLNNISQQLDNLLQMRMNGEIDSEEYLSTKSKLNSEKDLYENVRSSVRVNRDDVRNQLELFFDSAFNLEKVFSNGTLDQKSRVIYAVCEKIELDNRSISWNLRKPWQQMVEIKLEKKIDKWGG